MTGKSKCIDCGGLSTLKRCLSCHAVHSGREMCQFCDAKMSTKGYQSCYDCYKEHKSHPCIDCGEEAVKSRCFPCYAVFEGRQICAQCNSSLSSEGKSDCRKCFRFQKYGNECRYCGFEKDGDGKCFPCDAEAQGRYVCETCYLDYAKEMRNECQSCFALENVVEQ
jgi:hypothetical protein